MDPGWRWYWRWREQRTSAGVGDRNIRCDAATLDVSDADDIKNTTTRIRVMRMMIVIEEVIAVDEDEMLGLDYEAQRRVKFLTLFLMILLIDNC